MAWQNLVWKLEENVLKLTKKYVYIYMCVCVCVFIYIISSYQLSIISASKIKVFVYIIYVCVLCLLCIYKDTHIQYIHTCSELLVPLVNMIKECCENKCALLILLIFYLKKLSQKSKLSLENKNLKWGEISFWNKCFFFLKYMLYTITGTPRNSYE